MENLDVKGIGILRNEGSHNVRKIRTGSGFNVGTIRAGSCIEVSDSQEYTMYVRYPVLFTKYIFTVKLPYLIIV